MTRNFAIALALLVLPTTSFAAPDAKTATALDGLKGCKGIAEPTARLACFDRESERLVGAADRQEVVVMDKAEIKSTRRSLFGFTVPRIALFGAGRDDGEDISQIDVTVAGMRQLKDGKWAFTTSDGARWATTEFSPSGPKIGGKATLRKGALGSYFVKFDGGRATRAARTQ